MENPRRQGETNALTAAKKSLLRFLTLLTPGRDAGTAPVQPLRVQQLPEFGRKSLQDQAKQNRRS
jgi:hypothetical protein